MPFNRKKAARSMTHNGARYEWIDQPDDTVSLFSEANPGRILANYSDANDIVVLTMWPEALQQHMLEECLLQVFLMASGKPFGDISSGGADPAILGALAAQDSMAFSGGF